MDRKLRWEYRELGERQKTDAPKPDTGPAESPSISVLGLSVRPYNALRRAEIGTVGQLAALNDEEILDVPSLGPGALAEIRQKLDEYLVENPEYRPLTPEPSPPTQVEPTPVEPSPGGIPIQVLDLSARAHNCLIRADIRTVSQLAMLGDEQLLEIRNVGPDALAEIRQKLGEYLASHTEQYPPPEPEPEPATTPQPEPFATPLWSPPIEVLGLSVRACTCLHQAGIDTVGAVWQKLSRNEKDLLTIRNLGQACLTEIRLLLDIYFNRHPKVLALLLAGQEEILAQVIDPRLLTRANRVPLSEISINRLGLPKTEASLLRDRGVDSIGYLLREPAKFLDSPLVTKHLKGYLEWVVIQDERTWKDEIAGTGISPLFRLLLSGTTLDRLIADWLNCLGNKALRVVELRSGREGRWLTLAEVAQIIGVPPDRVQSIESRARRKLRCPILHDTPAPSALLVTMLVQLFSDAGGLMTEEEIRQSLAPSIDVQAADLPWALRLLEYVYFEFSRAEADSLWRLNDKSFHLVGLIQGELVKVLDDADALVPPEQLLSCFRASGFYQEHQNEFDAPFLAACLRTCQDILIVDGMCASKHSLKHRLLLAKSGYQVAFQGQPSTLEEWEHYLLGQVGQVELLGEIPISREECDQLGQALGAQLRTLGPSRALQLFQRQYPCAASVFLVGQGIYGYSGVDGYWPNVSRSLGRKLRPSWTKQLGELSEVILADLGLPLFPDLGGHRFVTLILLHGGIPDYCLPDFFANMLQPGVTKARYAGMSAAELMEEWRWRASGRYVTDKPVLYFLEFGGLVAQDFVERCLEMARETADSGSVPEAEELGLPPRVVVAYSHWVADQDVTQVRREAGDRWRLRKPEVRVDPWGEGILLDLPPQQVPVTAIHADITWQVQVGEEMVTVPVRVRRSGFDWKTVPEAVALRQPAAQYEATLLADGEPKRSWPYQGVDETRPILAFDLETGTLLSWTHSLPARRLALFYPAGLELSVEGQAHVLEEYDRLPRGWASYRGQAWDLCQARALSLASADEAILTVALRADEAAQRPFLEGGRLISPGKPGAHAPVYLGVPPCIRIPLSGRRTLEEELTLWRVTIQNRWAASPEVQRTWTLTELRAQVTANEGYVDLLLHHAALLGRAPFGNYQVRLRGPLGRDADLSLRLVPYLKFSGHEKLYLPDPKTGPQPAMLQVETLAEYGLECQGEEDDCRLREVGQPSDKRRYEVEVSPDTTAVDITLVKALPMGDVVRVPVPVSIRRLRWRLIDEGSTSGQLEWSGAAVKEPVDAFLQAQAPCLLVELPIQDSDPIHLQLRLVDVDGIERQVLEAPTPRQGQQRWRFELGACGDTVRHAWQSPVLRFELEARGLRGQKKALRWPVLSLTRTLVVENVKLRVRRAGRRAVFELEWHEPKPLRNRVVRFWPLWRPWDEVFGRTIPDDAQGTWSFEAPPDQLRSGKYRLQFVVVDPWVPQVPQKPPKDAPGTVDIALIPSEKQLRALDVKLSDHGHLLQIEECIDSFSRDLREQVKVFSKFHEERTKALGQQAEFTDKYIKTAEEYIQKHAEVFANYPIDSDGLKAASDKLVQAGERLDKAIVDSDVYEPLMQAFIDVLKKTRGGTKEDVEAAIASFKEQTLIVVKRAFEAARAVETVYPHQLSALRHAVQEIDQNMRQWLISLRDGGETSSEQSQQIHTHMEHFVDQIREAQRQSRISDPMMVQHWEDIEHRAVEGADTLESLLEEAIASQEHRGAVAQASREGKYFEWLLERAVVNFDAGNLEKAQDDWQWCYDHLDEGTLPQILALVELVQAAEDAAMLRTMQLKMFAASRFEPLLRDREEGTTSQEMFDHYLAKLPRSGLLSQATCRLLLTVEDETARLHAVQQLLSRGSAEGVEAILIWVEAARLSDDDAVSLLAQKPDFAAEALRTREGRPTADRLLQTLSQKAENVVRVGSWLRCNLGWGRIDGIEHRDTGASVRWCIGGSSPYRLMVTLRPDVCPETVIVDLFSSTAEFPEPGYVRTCTECELFSTQNLDLLSEHRFAAHRRGTYQDRKYFRDGLAKFRIEEGQSIPLSSFELVSVKPSKQLV